MTSQKAGASPLLAVPTQAQMRLLELVYNAFCRYGYWPIYQYAEALLYEELALDARAVLLECPTVSFPNSPARYGWFWSSEGRFESVQPGTRIGLTISGMTRLPAAAARVHRFLAIVRYLAERERSFTPSPAVVQSVDVRGSDLARDLPEWRCLLAPAFLAEIAEQMGNEPSTWRSRPHPPDASVWTASLTPLLREFAGVSGPHDYVERLTSWIRPPRRDQPAGPASSFALPEAIDYLNAVWRLHATDPLFRITRAESAAKLSQPCGTADEFDSRLSALCLILGQCRIPGQHGDRPLGDLRNYLRAHLPAEAAPRAEDAVGELQALFSLRAWRQHPGADQRGVTAMQKLGISLPTSDWARAWGALDARVVAALASLREEVDAGHTP